MTRIYAIVAIVSAIAVAVVALAIATFGTAHASERPQGRMQTCTAQWRQSGADRSGYKAFIRQCLEGTPSAQPSAGASKSPGGNRMKICGAKWRQAKASNMTHGQTWRQFSKLCLTGG